MTTATPGETDDESEDWCCGVCALLAQTAATEGEE